MRTAQLVNTHQRSLHANSRHITIRNESGSWYKAADSIMHSAGLDHLLNLQGYALNRLGAQGWRKSIAKAWQHTHVNRPRLERMKWPSVCVGSWAYGTCQRGAVNSLIAAEHTSSLSEDTQAEALCEAR